MLVQLKTLKIHFFATVLLLFFINNATKTFFDDTPLFLNTSTLDVIQKESVPTTKNHSQSQKKWTLILYISADNDLRAFAARNIKQLAAIGSNEYINIVVHLDIRIAGNQKITRRYYVEKNRILHVNPNDQKTERMDSGNPKTLISCCKWAIKQYPAENYGLVLWNHGTGILDPARGRIINPVQLFSFNPTKNKFEIDRSIEFFDWVDNNQRGICWDDSTGNYLTNEKLDQALTTVREKYMNNEKFAFIAFDACLMAMVEFAYMLKKHAHLMVASQEVELGTGYNYTLALEPFNTQSPTKEEFARHIVHAYAQSYSSITNDYTQSAIDLSLIDSVERSMHHISLLLIECLNKQKHNSVKNALKKSRNRLLCTHFDEPRYIDLHNLLSNIRSNIDGFQLYNSTEQRQLIQQLKNALDDGMKCISEAVIANTAGRSLGKAHGISVYFPEDYMHQSYPRTEFAANNAWMQFLQIYLSK